MTEHIEIDYHFVCDKLTAGLFKLLPIAALVGWHIYQATTLDDTTASTVQDDHQEYLLSTLRGIINTRVQFS